MNVIAMIALGCASCMAAREIDPQLLRLVPEDAFAVVGVDNERYLNSPFAKIDHADHEGFTGQTLEIALGDGPTRQLTIFTGDASVLKVQSQSTKIEPYKGFHIIQTDFGAVFAPFGAGVTLKGDDKTLRAVIDRYLDRSRPPAPLATEVQKMAASFDAWFVITKPLAHAGPAALTSLPGYALQAVEGIEEVRGGVRFGRVNDFEAQVTAAGSEEASALAVFGRWLPGVVRMGGPDERRLMDSIENLSAHASGRVVTLSFSVADSRIEQLLEEDERQRKAGAEQTVDELAAPGPLEPHF